MSARPVHETNIHDAIPVEFSILQTSICFMKFTIEAAEKKKYLDTLRPIEPSVLERVMKKFQLDWNYHSNNLEGNSLSFGETKALLLHNITAQGKPLKDHIEITGHNEAIELMLDVVKGNRPLTEHFIREIHTLLLKQPYSVNALTPDGLPSRKTVLPGVYKSTPNHVRTASGELFRFAEPEETPAKMHDLVTWYRNKSDSGGVHPVLLAAEFHYRFVRIHPFDDGNGRTARILMNFILMQHDYPPVIIRTEDKQAYFSALQQADGGALEPFIEYVAQNLVRSLDIMLRAIQGESIDDPDDFDKEIALLEQKLRTTGKPAKVFKSKEVLQDFFQGTLLPLATELDQATALFNRFYARTAMTVWFDNTGLSYTDIIKQPDHINQTITDFCKEIKLNKEFQAFTYPSFAEFNYTSSLVCRFYETRYIIQDERGESRFENLYSEPLSENERKELIQNLRNQHKSMLETKLSERPEE
jgi:Fic family protein